MYHRIMTPDDREILLQVERVHLAKLALDKELAVLKALMTEEPAPQPKPPTGRKTRVAPPKRSKPKAATSPKRKPRLARKAAGPPTKPRRTKRSTTRHVRCGSWRPAVTARRIRRSAENHIRLARPVSGVVYLSCCDGTWARGGACATYSHGLQAVTIAATCPGKSEGTAAMILRAKKPYFLRSTRNPK
jgi:hypothetical protein